MHNLSPLQLQQAYESGFSGLLIDDDARDQRRADCVAQYGSADVEDLATSAGWAGGAAGQLVVGYVHSVLLYPGCWPGGAQGRGDCVSWGQRNSYLYTLGCDVASGVPDSVTGRLEGAPEVSADGIRFGVLSTEYIYGFRGHGGDGWDCDSSAQVVAKYGAMLRQNYPDLGIDYTRYSASLAGKYGPNNPPEAMQAVGRLHCAGVAADIQSMEALRDALANGHGVNGCGGEGFENVRNEHGVSRRSGSWSHSMAEIAYDDRPWAHETYGGPLVALQQSWGEWNTGPRDIYDSARLIPPELVAAYTAAGLVNPKTGNLMLPVGAFWVRARDVAGRNRLATPGVRGWEAKKCNPLQTVFG